MIIKYLTISKLLKADKEYKMPFDFISNQYEQ
jgi:hypothetical protein